MMPTLTTQFWIQLLFVIVFLIVIVMFFIVKKMNRFARIGSPEDSTDHKGIQKQVENQILETLSPLLEASRQTALQFEDQIKEKKRLIRELNEALDSRIISINLLLSRTEAQQKKIESHYREIRDPSAIPLNTSRPDPADSAGDTHEQILALHGRNMDIRTISEKLSIPEGEVSLVIELKKKLLEMEKSSP